MLREREAIKVDEALSRVLKHIKPLKIEEIPLEEADGRILAEPLIADHSVPPFDRAAMDGFAIRYEDSIGASPNHPITLEVIEVVGAGNVANKVVGPGQAIRIMTGAPTPKGATGVIMFEKTRASNQENHIEILASVLEWENISLAGEDVQQGETLLQVGTRIGPGEVTLLSTFGYARVKVYRRPVVGICASGNELLPIDAALEPGKIRNSNSYMVASQVRRVGGIPKILSNLPDTIEEAYQVLEAALTEVDILITSGGVSVGDYDLMYDVFQRLGAEILFDKLLMRPGKPTTVAVRGDQLIFGLSGNPGACFVGFELFVRPTIGRMGNQPLRDATLPKYSAIIETDFAKPSAFPRYIRAFYYVKGNELYVSPAGVDKSGLTKTIQMANCLAYIPAGGQGVMAGTKITIYALGQPGEDHEYHTGS